jgi:hypothetical protein
MIAAGMVGCYEYGWQVSARFPARRPRRTVTLPGANGPQDRHPDRQAGCRLSRLPGNARCQQFHLEGRDSHDSCAHGHGIAIDINIAWSNYWRYRRTATGGYSYENRIPWEIVEVFEKHGFIWGCKWYHYDTMHFEYRPELLL